MKVSIVCAYNNQVEMTLKFLDKMQETTKSFLDEESSIEMILVNGGNPVDIQHPFITKLIHLDKNIGFSVTVNEGLKAVSRDSDYIFYVGNDSFPTYDGWLDDLIELQNKTNAGIVCPATTRPPMNEMIKRCMKVDYSDYFEVQFFPSIAYLITKECFDSVGYWDEAFINSGMYGDNDYCIRVCIKGFKIVVSKNILLNHLLSQEVNKLFDVKKDMLYNEAVLKKKWGLNA